MGSLLKKDVRVIFAASSSRSLQNIFRFSPGKKIGIFMIKSFTTRSSPSEMADCMNRRMHIIVCRSSQLCWRHVRTTRRRLNSASKLKANKVEAQLQSSTMMFCWMQSGWFISASSWSRRRALRDEAPSREDNTFQKHGMAALSDVILLLKACSLVHLAWMLNCLTISCLGWGGYRRERSAP